MGHVRKLEGKRATTFQACWRDSSGRQRTATFPSRKLATAYLRQVEADTLTGVHVDPTDARITLAQWNATWRTTLTCSEATRYRIDQQWRCYVAPRWADVPIGRITTLDVQAWAATLSRTLAASTVRGAVALLSQQLAAAVRARLLGANPAALERGQLPRHTRPPERHLDAAGVEALTEAVRGVVGGPQGAQAAALVHVAAWSGLRWGELTALTWRDVQPAGVGVVLRVDKAVQDVAGVRTVGPPKTAGSRRDVVCDDDTRRLLTELRMRSAHSGEADRVFARPRGGILSDSEWQGRHFRPAVRALRLDGFTFHQLRHTHASLMIAGGMNILTLSRRLGHASAKMTLDRYGHLQRDHVDATLQALARARQRPEGGGRATG